MGLLVQHNMADPTYNKDTMDFLAVQKKMGSDKQGDYFGLEQWELMSPAAKAFMIKTLLGIVENMPPPSPTMTPTKTYEQELAEQAGIAGPTSYLKTPVSNRRRG